MCNRSQIWSSWLPLQQLKDPTSRERGGGGKGGEAGRRRRRRQGSTLAGGQESHTDYCIRAAPPGPAALTLWGPPGAELPSSPLSPPTPPAGRSSPRRPLRRETRRRAPGAARCRAGRGERGRRRAVLRSGRAGCGSAGRGRAVAMGGNKRAPGSQGRLGGSAVRVRGG